MTMAMLRAFGSALVGTFYRFDASGVEEDWIVPAGVTMLRAYLFGASGGGGIYSSGSSGPGGYAQGDIAVTPGETLKIRVARAGGAPTQGVSGGLGGWPGGGSGSYGDTHGGGGGGYSGIFRGATPLIIAGGGGGHAGWVRHATAGGGTTAATTTAGSTGGGQSSGGTSTGGGESGGYLQGGDANFGDRTTSTGRDSAGGGGGYYGGAPDDLDGGAGSGGSSYLGSAANAVTYAGDDGLHVVSSSAPATVNGETVAPRGNGVLSVMYGNTPNAGNDGVIWLEVIG